MKEAVDHGYAWVVLLGSFMVNLLTLGSVKTYGILYAVFLQDYQSSSGNTAWIGSLIFLLAGGLGPFSNFFSERFSFRNVTAVGGVLIGTGYMLTGVVPRLEYIYLTLGILAGLGYGLAITPSATIINFYFEKRRALANGIVVSGSGIGAFCLPTLYRLLIDKYGLQWALAIIGAIILNVCVAASLFPQPAIYLKKKARATTEDKTTNSDKTSPNHTEEAAVLINDENKGSVEEDKSKCCANGPEFKLSLFKQMRFTIAVLALMACANGYSVNIILIPAHIQSLGYERDKMVLAVSVMGACEVCARILMGWFADLELIHRKYIFIICMFIGGIGAFIAPFLHNIYLIVSYAALLGIFPGSFLSFVAILIIDVVGMKDFTSAFGLLYMCVSFSIFIGQPFAGWLADITGNWTATFFFSGVFMIVSGLLYLTEPLLLRCCGQAMTNVPKDERKDNSEEMQDKSTDMDQNHVLNGPDLRTESAKTNSILSSNPTYDEGKGALLAPIVDTENV